MKFNVVFCILFIAGTSSIASAQLGQRCTEEGLSVANVPGRNAWAAKCGYISSNAESFYDSNQQYAVFTAGCGHAGCNPYIPVSVSDPCISGLVGLGSCVAPTAPSCVLDGGVDDTLGQTSCCSGFAVPGSTVCSNPADFETTWASCNQICGTAPVNGCIPSGGWDDTLSGTRCCSGRAVPGSTWCLDPSDFGTDWKSCVQKCQ